MKNVLLCLLVMSSFIASSGYAKSQEEVKAWLLQVRPDIPIESVTESPLDGFYTLNLTGGTMLHITRDGLYFLTGDLYQVTASELVNLTENSRNGKRKALLDSLDESEMLVFAPEHVKKTVTVFTDVDCTYCRKLHREVPAMNELGIAIRYLAYPRAGIGSPTYDVMVSAWCADDPKTALTKAKAGETIPAKTCPNPVAKQYQLGGEMGVNGTPALLLEDGTLLPGYLPADALAARLGINP
jgi:thiol:disulfide interchange protein DsbC